MIAIDNNKVYKAEPLNNKMNERITATRNERIVRGERILTITLFKRGIEYGLIQFNGDEQKARVLIDDESQEVKR